MQHPFAVSGFTRRTLAVAGGALGGAVLAASRRSGAGRELARRRGAQAGDVPGDALRHHDQQLHHQRPRVPGQRRRVHEAAQREARADPGEQPGGDHPDRRGDAPGRLPAGRRAFHQLVSEGGARDLQPFFQAAKDVKLSDYYPHLLKGQTFQGKLVAVPEDFQPASVLYYNKSLLGKAGEAAPTPDLGWAQFLELSPPADQGGRGRRRPVRLRLPQVDVRAVRLQRRRADGGQRGEPDEVPAGLGAGPPGAGVHGRPAAQVQGDAGAAGDDPGRSGEREQLVPGRAPGDPQPAAPGRPGCGISPRRTWTGG